MEDICITATCVLKNTLDIEPILVCCRKKDYIKYKKRKWWKCFK